MVVRTQKKTLPGSLPRTLIKFYFFQLLLFVAHSASTVSSRSPFRAPLRFLQHVLIITDMCNNFCVRAPIANSARSQAFGRLQRC